MDIGVPQPRARAIITKLVREALQAVDPYGAVSRHVSLTSRILRVGPRAFALKPRSRVVVVGAGKASARMAQALEGRLGSRIAAGVVVVKYGHTLPTKTIRVVEAGHPVPDAPGLAAAQDILNLCRSLGKDDVLIVLLSGGASSLLPSPVPGISLADKQTTTKLLLRSGATIQEMNAVRKHLSAVKGGQLAGITSARVLSLILSDVIGNDLATIGSGPTTPDPTTFRQAKEILDHYDVFHTVPAAVRKRITDGIGQLVPETPKPGAALFRRVHNCLIGDNEAAVDAVLLAARREKLKTLVLGTTLTGEARDAAKCFGALAREIDVRKRPLRRPCLVVAGGELTVTVRGQGTGGRAQEFALAAASEIMGIRNGWVAGFATDGTDGPTDVAGAVVDGQTMARAERAGVSVTQALQENNAYPLFRQLRGHIRTGPTGTNVNDLYLLLLL
ncbi:MAG: glycerate kinase [Nitrospiraceae bacterium]|nr:glycerate kinase [Nitrospiraceae bacterium]